MPRIVETIVTTLDADGTPYIAPLGLIADGDNWIIAPFRPSRTLANLERTPFAVASHTDDVRVFAGGVTMSLGMLVHEASVLVVILNAMRLLR